MRVLTNFSKTDFLLKIFEIEYSWQSKIWGDSEVWRRFYQNPSILNSTVLLDSLK